MILDHSVYPDLANPPVELADPLDKADYMHRICGAWDFGVPPLPDTFQLFAGWKDIFDAFPVAHSPAYHAFREILAWEPVARTPWSGQCTWEILDVQEGRTDPCLHMV